MKALRLKANASTLSDAFRKGTAAVDAKPRSKVQTAFAELMNPPKAAVAAPEAPKTFLEKMSKIGSKGHLSPRSQRLLGGLSGAKYGDIKADFVPSEKAKIEAIAKAKKAEHEKVRKLQAGEDSSENDQEAEEDEEALSPGTILRRARRTSSVCKATMDEADKVLAASSKLIAAQFKGMSESKMRERIKITFDTYDLSKDGLLQVEELQRAFTSLGQTVTMEEVQQFRIPTIQNRFRD